LRPPLRISDEAGAEIAEAVRWYEQHCVGLGAELLASLDEAVARLAATPQVGSRIPGVVDQSIRRVFVARFPYHVVYIELPDRLQVLAVAHDRRRPTYWSDRLSR
jgi:plasmid stabilization system protein ParE